MALGPAKNVPMQGVSSTGISRACTHWTVPAANWTDPRALLLPLAFRCPAFMMYMTGGGIQIFSVMSVWFLLKQAVQGLFSVDKG